MILTIELKPETRARLDAKAEAQGITATELARRLIEEALPEKPMPMSGAEAIDYWEREGVRGVNADREGRQN